MPQVLIVGAGPTGLTMALELQRHGISFRIIDKQIKPVQTSNALAVQPRTLDVWEDQGILTAALARGNKIHGVHFYIQNKEITHINTNLIASRHPFMLGLAQHQTESILLEYLHAKNIPVEMNVEFISFVEKDTEMAVTLRHPDGQTEVIATPWIIACDGGHSAVRTHANVAFLGKELSQHFVFADVKIKSAYPQNEVNLCLSSDGPFAIIQFDKDYFRIIAEVTHDPELSAAKSLTYAQLKRLIQQRCPITLEIDEPIWTSGFWIHERIATSFRHKNIFFAGDAAHIHSPAGGQGMNTGIQDAYNLAWKLALVINKKANPDILNSYHLERYPVAKTVLRNTTLLTNIIAMRNPILCKIRNFMLSHLLKIKKIRKKFVSNIAQIEINYTSPLNKDCLTNNSGPKVGTQMPGNNSLMDAVRGTQFCLLFFSGKYNNLGQYEQLTKLLKQKYPKLIKFILIHPNNALLIWNGINIFDEHAVIHQLYAVKAPTFYLIRPDKYIGFRGEIKHAEQLIEYLQKIFTHY